MDVGSPPPEPVETDPPPIQRPGEGGPLVVVRDLHVSYGPKRVLEGVDLELQPREILAVVGGSGSGKSTLLRAMIGALQPQQGEVRIDGCDLNCADRGERADAADADVLGAEPGRSPGEIPEIRSRNR